MKVKEIAKILSGKVLSGDDNADIVHFYTGDFLSRVMTRAPSDSCWITVINNINVVGVALLAKIKLIVFCDGLTPAADVVEKCKQEKIGVITTCLTAFDCCKYLGQKLL